MNSAAKTFKSLFEVNYQALCLYVARYGYKPEEAEDIVQSMYIKLWENMASKPETATRAYLYTMVKNSLIDLSRLKKIDIINISSFSDKFYAFFQPELDEAGTVDKVLSAINNLPEKARIIVNAVFINGKKYKEVAAEMNISENTVKTQLQRSLRTLRKSLAKEDFDIFISLLM